MIYVRDLLELESFQNFKLVSGKTGLNRKVTWPNIAQTVSIREWLVGGDVIIMTGIGLGVTAEFLVSIVEQAADAKASCIIMLLHEEHIKEVPEETIQYANTRNFPIFAAPWETKLSNLIMEISNMVFNDQYYETIMNEFIESLISNKIDFSNKENNKRLMEYDLYSPHMIAMIRFTEQKSHNKKENGQKANIRNQIYAFMNNELCMKFGKCLYITHTDEIIFVIPSKEKDTKELKKIFEKILEHMHQEYPEEKFRIGVGEIVKEPKELEKSYKQAEKTFLVQADKAVVLYDDLGIYQLLLEIEDQSLISRYVYQHLESVMEYDEKYEQELLDTLRVYLEENGNLVQAARKLYIHRNTMVNRINKLEELLEVSLREADKRNMLYNCLTLYDYIKR